MSIVIVGGNECMECQYKTMCKKYNCKVKVYTKFKGMKGLGSPDLVVFFTNTVSHKMIQHAMASTKGSSAKIVRSHSSSISSLKEILETYAS